MPGTNARGHKIPLGAELTVTRQTIFEEFAESIRDIVPVANTTARTSLVAALTSAGEGPSTTRPLYVHRLDARGLHRIEYTVDGSVWIPASGILSFTTKALMDSFGTTNGSYLTVNDEARVGAIRYLWDGTQWVVVDTGWQTLPMAFNSGWSKQTGDALESRLVSGQLFLTGRLNATAGAGVNPFADPLPEGFRPSRPMVAYVGTTGGNGASYVVSVDTAGVIYVYKTAGVAVNNLPLQSIPGMLL